MKRCIKNFVAIKTCFLCCIYALLSNLNVQGSQVEISLDLRLDATEYLLGEKIRAVVTVNNNSPDLLEVGPGYHDRLFLELFRETNAGVNYPILRNSKRSFTVPFKLEPGKRQRFEVFFDRHFPFVKSGRYTGRAVVTHDGMRYEGPLRTFDVVPGMPVCEALQMFADQPELKRKFELIHWSRNRVEHLFLRATDEGWIIHPDRGDVERSKVKYVWSTADLGPYLSLKSPKLSVAKNGEVTIVHMATQDVFIHTLYWSLPEVLELQKQEEILDPEVAASKRVKELYKASEGVEPVKKAWWKFW